MISITIKEYLEKQLQLPCFMELPEQLPEQFLVLEVKGMGQENHLHRATAIVQSYAPSRYEAAQLNERVKAAMESLTQLQEISRCELNTDYDYTNTAAKQYRWQAVFDLMYYRKEPVYGKFH